MTGTVDSVRERLAGWVSSHPAPDVVFGLVAPGTDPVQERLAETTHPGRAADDLVFRIASLTKSFTAATVLSLRDDGLLRLDDSVADLVPDLVGARGWKPAEIEVRDLLTMSAGFTEDNPWADRQGDLDGEAFLSLLLDGVTTVRPPGHRHEYSNLSYAILGLIIERVSDERYDRVVAERFFRPLGLNSTTFHAETVAGPLVPGFERREGSWVPDDSEGYGAFSAMGGMFSTSADMCRWISYLMAEETSPGVALSARSLRAMQRIQAAGPLVAGATAVGGQPRFRATGYGFGLRIDRLPAVGDIVGHSGGYPGYGCHMAWHRPTGIGLVVLANARYHPVWDLTRQAVAEAVSGSGAPVTQPSPATMGAVDAVNALLVFPDQGEMEDLFAPNFEADVGLERLRSRLIDLRSRLGPSPVADPVPVAPTPAQATWRVSGELLDIDVTVTLTPELNPKIQRLAIVELAHPPKFVREAAEEVARLLVSGAPRSHPQVAGVEHLTALVTGPATVGPLLAVAEGRASYRLSFGADTWVLDIDYSGGKVTGVEAQRPASSTELPDRLS